MAALPWPTGARRAIVYGRGGYLVARGDEAIAGSTMEFAGFHPGSHRRGPRACVRRGHRPLPRAHQRRRKSSGTWAGLRPVTPDGLPIIGAEPRLAGLWYATGHGRHGILLAGLTGLLIKQLVGGEPAAEDLAAFSPSRFYEL